MSKLPAFGLIFLKTRHFIRFLTIFGEDFKTTHPQQHKVLCDYIRDFSCWRHLEDDAKLNFKKNSIELNKLAQRFSENLLDSTKATAVTVNLNKEGEPNKSLEGIPTHVLELSKKEAKKRNVDGYVFSLQPPIYLPIIEYSSNRMLSPR